MHQERYLRLSPNLSSASFDLNLRPPEPESWVFYALALWITCANWHQNRLIYFQNIVFTSLLTDARTNRQVDNIMLPPACLAWRRHKICRWTGDDPCVPGVLHCPGLNLALELYCTTYVWRRTIQEAQLVLASQPSVLSGHNIEYLCLNLFTLRRFNNNESSGGRQILLPLLGGDAPRLGW